MGAEVTGYALLPVQGSLFKLTNLEEEITSHDGNVCDYDKLEKALESSQAEIVFHLAAQPLVIESYNSPIETFQSNTTGTIHLLEALRKCTSVKAGVFVTSDKCYENKEQPRSFREDDPLGGFDPYSASKAMAELAISAYRKSFFDSKYIASARAGNVIGGGDFARYRIVPDLIRSIEEQSPLTLRNPHSTRPWLHVLDVLYGYLLLGKKLFEEPESAAQAFNFAPDRTADDYTVKAIIEAFKDKLSTEIPKCEFTKPKHHESKYLKLDSSLANRFLYWSPIFTTAQAIEWTARWYDSYLKKTVNLKKTTIEDIQTYLEITNSDS